MFMKAGKRDNYVFAAIPSPHFWQELLTDSSLGHMGPDSIGGGEVSFFSTVFHLSISALWQKY